MTSIHTRSTSLGSSNARELNVQSGPYGLPVGTHRLEGPALPPNGSPDRKPGLERLDERLIQLAFGKRPEGYDPPPLETYTVTSTEHGDICCATQEYVRWFCRTYPAAGPEDRARVPSPRPSSEGYGGGTDLNAL